MNAQREVVATGCVALASCLNAMGVPPERDPQPFKASNRDDFVRIAMGGATLDGRHRTRDLMRLWGRGPAGVRENPQDPFSVLQVWAKTRSAVISASKGKRVWLCECAGWPILLADKDVEDWSGPERIGLGMTEFGADARCPGLTAALITLGVPPAGVRGGVRLRVTMQPSEQYHAIAAGWPGLPEDVDSSLAYMAAAEQARRSILDAIKQKEPRLFLERGTALGVVDPEKLEEGDKKTEEIVRRLT